MSKMTLLELKLINFKGIKEFTLSTNGTNVKVFGDNATGKTTLFDAFIWLLFDKDSQNKNDFEIKTLKDGQTIHNINHEVEGVFDLDGRELKLKKVYFEKWTTKRGNQNAEMTGHTTDYFIDDVPSQKKEYTKLVSSIVDEEIFKLLTSPTYFNSDQFHWQKRREILLEVCGNISDIEVIESDKKLSKLTEVLTNRSVESHKKILLAKRKEINQQRERLPDRIDEVDLAIPDVSGLDEDNIDQEIAILQSDYEAKEAELSRIQNGGEISSKEKQLREIEGQLLDIKNQLNAETHQKISHKRQELYEIKNQIDVLQLKIQSAERQIKNNEVGIELGEEKANDLRRQWQKFNNENFSFEEHQTTCPTCGQDLPEEQIEETRSKAEAHFNKEKSDRLEWIQQEGKKEMSEVNKLRSKNETLSSEIDSVKQEVESLKQKLSEVQEVIDSLQSAIKSPQEDSTYKAKQQESEDIKNNIKQLKESVQESADKVRAEMNELKEKRNRLNQEKAKFGQVDTLSARKKELEEKQRDLGKQLEKIDEELFLLEEFTKAKVNLMEEKINSKFKYARFKLFSEQINGGLKETCVTTFEGVPYDSLNTAGKIQVGMDIITTLQDHFGYSVPIWIDNRESVVRLPDMKCQVISLIVSEGEKKLRIITTGGN